MGIQTAQDTDTAQDAPRENGKEAGSSQKVWRPVKIVMSTMVADYEKSAVEIAHQAFDSFKQSKDIATYIKKEYDKRYPSDGRATDGVYHCIVGRHFAASVSHETRFFIHLRVGHENVVIFKSKDSPFDTDQVELGK